MTVQELTARLREVVQRSPPGAGSLKLNLKGAGFIHVSGSIVSNDDLPADCTLVIGKDNLDALIDGSLDSQSALMDGKLELLGDVGVAAVMQSALMAAWVQAAP